MTDPSAAMLLVLLCSVPLLSMYLIVDASLFAAQHHASDDSSSAVSGERAPDGLRVARRRRHRPLFVQIDFDERARLLGQPEDPARIRVQSQHDVL